MTGNSLESLPYAHRWAVEEREGTEEFRGSERNPGLLLGAKGAPREGPNSREPRCGSSEHETNNSGPLCMSACVRKHDRGCRCGCVYVSVYLCAQPGCACVYVRVWSECVPSSLWSGSYTPQVVQLEPLLLAPLRTPGDRTTHHCQEAPPPLGLLNSPWPA